jgi:murein DD-endopeptidase MepM/ murein hydrolase activator NlpD
MIQIKHDNGLMTRYGHARKLLVQVGDTVKKGQFIGLVGSTGRSTGNHLHYEVIFGGQSIDPEQLMKNN